MKMLTKEMVEKAVANWCKVNRVKREFTLTYVYTTNISEEPTIYIFDEDSYACAEVVFHGFKGRAVWFDMGFVGGVFTGYRAYHSPIEPKTHELRAIN